MSRDKLAILFIGTILIVDQILKVYIKTHMMLGEEFNVLGNWFIIHFTENNGMAFGFEFGGKPGKIALSIFRIIAITGIGWYLVHLIKHREARGLIISVSLIFAGALGNIIDSVFYGMIFTDSYHQVAALNPSESYSSFLHGKVVDMFYFPIFKGYLPGWLPVWGDKYFVFFRPVFNIADTAITTGVLMILVFQKKYFKKQ